MDHEWFQKLPLVNSRSKRYWTELHVLEPTKRGKKRRPAVVKDEAQCYRLPDRLWDLALQAATHLQGRPSVDIDACVVAALLHCLIELGATAPSECAITGGRCRPELEEENMPTSMPEAHIQDPEAASLEGSPDTEAALLPTTHARYPEGPAPVEGPQNRRGAEGNPRPELTDDPATRAKKRLARYRQQLRKKRIK